MVMRCWLLQGGSSLESMTVLGVTPLALWGSAQVLMVFTSSRMVIIRVANIFDAAKAISQSVSSSSIQHKHPCSLGTPSTRWLASPTAQGLHGQPSTGTVHCPDRECAQDAGTGCPRRRPALLSPPFVSRSPGLPLLQGERCCIGSRKLAPLARDHISACLRPQLLGAVFGCPCVMHMRAAGRAL